MKRTLWTPLLALLLLGAGCSRANRVTAPIPDPENAVYACGGWGPAAPSATFAIFDCEIYVTDPLGAIDRAGGTVIHVYDGIPFVRARLPMSTFQAWKDAVWTARRVKESDAFVFPGIVSFAETPTPEDRAFLEQVGVVVKSETPLGLYVFLAGLVPDSSVSAIRAHPRVLRVGLNSTVCPLDAAVAQARSTGVRSGFPTPE